MSSSLTVQELLREASATSSVGPTVPLDEQVKRLRKSFWEHDYEPVPSSLPTFRRIRVRWTPRLDMALGIGALLAALLITAGLLLHSFRMGAGEPHLAMLPPSTAVNAVAPIAFASISTVKPSTRSAIIATSSPNNPLLPVITGWRLWTTNAGSRTSDSRIAYYQRGNEIVELTLIRTPTAQPRLLHPLQACADGVRIVSSPKGTLQISPQEAIRYGRDCLLFDYSPKAAAAWRIFTANPYLPNLPHTISWYEPPYVATIGADSSQTRDAFAQAYLAAVKP